MIYNPNEFYTKLNNRFNLDLWPIDLELIRNPCHYRCQSNYSGRWKYRYVGRVYVETPLYMPGDLWQPPFFIRLKHLTVVCWKSLNISQSVGTNTLHISVFHCTKFGSNSTNSTWVKKEKFNVKRWKKRLSANTCLGHFS